ncbi:MAG: metal-binding protein [Crenarchaeota archaeon]|nr:metal-binding protein [Thermoproteota archaeon]
MTKCIFYQSTRDGDRCILMPPEEWRLRRGKFIEHCLSGGKNCPILANYYKMKQIATNR